MGELIEQLAWIDRLRIQALAARECQQFARQSGAAPDRAQRAAENLMALRAVGKIRFQQLQVAGDHRQHVVEVMRDATGQLADGVESLRMRELLFGAVAPWWRRAARH
jgi:hypothetical protein